MLSVSQQQISRVRRLQLHHSGHIAVIVTLYLGIENFQKPLQSHFDQYNMQIYCVVVCTCVCACVCAYMCVWVCVCV